MSNVRLINRCFTTKKDRKKNHSQARVVVIDDVLISAKDFVFCGFSVKKLHDFRAAIKIDVLSLFHAPSFVLSNNSRFQAISSSTRFCSALFTPLHASCETVAKLTFLRKAASHRPSLIFFRCDTCLICMIILLSLIFMAHLVKT